MCSLWRANVRKLGEGNSDPEPKDRQCAVTD